MSGALVVEIVKGKGRQPWRVKLFGANGLTLNTSEGYASKWNAKRAAKRMFPGVKPTVRVEQQG